jgi:hypothetical protein
MVSGLNSLMVPAEVVVETEAVPPPVVVVTEVWADASGLRTSAAARAIAPWRMWMCFIFFISKRSVNRCAYGSGQSLMVDALTL